MWMLTHAFFAETFQPMNAAVTFQIGLNDSARAFRGKFTFAGAWESCRGIRAICITIFRSWVAIYQFLPPIASSSHSLYNLPGFAPRMDVLFWGRNDFQISFSNRDTPRNAKNHHLRSFMVDAGILSNNMKLPSHEC